MGYLGLRRGQPWFFSLLVFSDVACSLLNSLVLLIFCIALLKWQECISLLCICCRLFLLL